MATNDPIVASVHDHVVSDNDSYYIIDSETREITNSANATKIIMQNDHNSERITFELDRYVDDHDMSLCNSVRVHYNNIGKVGKNISESKSLYFVDDLAVSEDDPTKVTCSWLISRSATMYPGTLSFAVQYRCLDNDSVVYEWHSDIFSDIKIKEVINNEDSIGEDPAITDMINQWRSAIFSAGETVITNINTAKNAFELEMDSIANQKINSIRAAGDAVLDNLPTDYTDFVDAISEEAVANNEYESIKEYAKKIHDVQTNKTLTLGIISDIHYSSDVPETYTGTTMVRDFGKITDYVHYDAIADLGDNIYGNSTKDIARNDIMKVVSNINKNSKCPVCYVRGNHDDNGWYSFAGTGTYKVDEMINDVEWYNLAFGFTRGSVVTDPARPTGGYGYFDHEDSKIRVFLLNTVDIPYVADGDTYRYTSYESLAFTNEQINFVANSLKFEDKESPNEWAALFLMHVPLDVTSEDGLRIGGTDAKIRGHLQMLQVITAYRKGISYSFTGTTNHLAKERPEDFQVNVSVDYSDKGVGDVIGFICGHCHVDNASQKVGYNTWPAYGYTYMSFIGTSTIVVDRDKNTITAIKRSRLQNMRYWDSLYAQGGVHPNRGAIDAEVEFGIDMSNGTWVIPFTQFRPTGENLYTGLSSNYGTGGLINTTATLNTDTLELNSAGASTKYVIGKAVRTLGYTQYIIPSGFIGMAYFYNGSGRYVGSATLTNMTGHSNVKMFTTGSSTKYVVFCINTSAYTDYENFYCKELSSDVLAQ